MDCPKCQAPNADTQVFCGQCGSDLRPAASVPEDVTRPSPEPRGELETGTAFAGRYQIIEELGHGGMGRVYKVVDKEVHAKIALKLIKPEIASDRATIDRFRQELKTAREISHKNICRMYDLGRDGGTYFLTMEYVSGQDLKTMIAMSGQLGVGTALSIARQVCEGLSEAHRLGIIHRDLKPQNIQIDKGGHAKIMDFGIARSVMAKGLTDAGVVIGTPQYMSPEQVDAKDVDARSDLYALGIILYEMLTGRVPFDGDTALSVAVKQKLERPRDPRELNAAIPPDLGQLILKCLEKDKGQRYQSATEVRADLEQIEQGLPRTAKVVPQERPGTSKEITVHFTMRQLLVPALVVVALIVIAIGAWQLWPRRAANIAMPPGGKPTLAVLYFENLSGDAALNMWRTGLPELIITSLTQSRLLNVVSSENIFSILKSLNLTEARRYSAEDLASVAREGNAQYLLTGSVMKAGPSTVIMARLLRAGTGEVVRSERLECSSEQEILSKVDGLTRGIKADLDLSPQEIASDISQPAAQVLTASPEALRYYTEARRLHLNGAYRDAVPLYQRAIDADPAFAMAYRGVSACYSNLGQLAKRREAVQKALASSDRLPERFRWQIELTAYSFSTATYPQVIEVGQKLLAQNPNDMLAQNYLSNVLCEAEEYEKCAEHREAAARADPSYLYVSSLASSYASLGRYDRRRNLLERYLEREPKSVAARVSLGRGYLYDGQLDEAQREAEKATLLEPRDVPAILLKGDIAYLRGDFPAAEREYSSLLEQAAEGDRQSAHFCLFSVCMTQGRFAKARERLDLSVSKGMPNFWQPWLELNVGQPGRALKGFQSLIKHPVFANDLSLALYLRLGLVLSHIALGDMAGAEKAADDFKAFQEGVFTRKKARLGLLISAALALKRGDARTAVADVERGVSQLPHQSDSNDEHAVWLDLLGEAYMAAGDLAMARETYEKITTLTSGRLAWGAVYARSFYHLGLIAEQQGDKARAREQFGKFLELWKNADPGQPEVADAKKRLR